MSLTKIKCGSLFSRCLLVCLLPGALSPAAFAEETKAPFPIGSKFSRTVQTVTGLNLVAGFVASRAAQSALRKKTGGKVKVHVKTYSLTDLMAGKVKSFDAQVEEPKFEGVPLSSVKVSSSGPIWYQYKKTKETKRGMQTPVTLAVHAEVNQSDIEEALNSPKVIGSLRGLKLNLPGLDEEQLQVLSPKVAIKDETINLAATLVVKGQPPETGVAVKISARPTLVDGSKIIFADLKVDGGGIVEPEKFAAFAETLLNPVVDFARMDRRDHAFRLSSLQLSGDSMVGDGNLLLAPQEKDKSQLAGNNKKK